MIMGKKACAIKAPGLVSMSGGLGISRVPEGSSGSMRGGRSIYILFANLYLPDHYCISETAKLKINEIANKAARTMKTNFQLIPLDFFSAGMGGKLVLMY
jgi:hypothetical protein